MVEKKLKINFFIIIFIVILMFSTQVTYAKYVKSEISSFKSEIVKPILQIDKGNIVQIDENNNIGYYEFNIKNFDDEKISEVEFLYTIEIISNLEENVQFELYNENQKIELNNLKTENLEINANEKMEQKYLLKIFYNPSNKVEDEGKKECIEKIQIKVNLVQQKL